LFYFTLSKLIQKEPGVIVGPIAKAMGWIIDQVFNLVYPLTQRHSLGLSIIILTIIVRFLMMPLSVKSQKSMVAMQKLNPEMEAIKNKYGNTKDPELSKKMNAEIQALYAKNKVNPLSGCLPLLIQMPIFFALTYLMNQSFLYIAKLGAIYSELAEQIAAIPNYTKVMVDIIIPHVPKDMTIDISRTPDMVKALNTLGKAEWDSVFAGLSSLASQGAMELLSHTFVLKEEIEVFFGIQLLANAGYMFPGVLIPVITTGTMFLSSWLTQKATPQAAKDKNQAMQQKMMMYGMPLLFGAFTINYPAGVGIYWTASQVFQVVQQLFFNKKYRLGAPAKAEETGSLKVRARQLLLTVKDRMGVPEKKEEHK